MIPLALSILFSSVLFVIFKYFGKFNVNNFQAITINYLAGAGLGFLLSPVNYSLSQLPQKPWTISAIIFGVLFIGMFYIMAVSSQKVGVAISTVANKMSLAIPVIAGVVLYDESLGLLKLLGVIVALVSVIMVTFPSKKLNVNRKYLALPFIIFIVSGFLDTFFKYVQTHQLRDDEIAIFTSSIFLVSASVGLTIMVARRLVNGSILESKSIIAGVALSIPNYFSIYFLLEALNLPNLQSTVIFPINNTGIVLLSTLLAIILFSERLSKLNWAGIGLAITSIALITIG